MPQSGIKVISVENNSPAYSRGIRPDSRIISINGHLIKDRLDYFFFSADLKLNIRWIDCARKARSCLITKENSDDDIGIEVENFKIIKCRCNCIFCFINQLPKGLRRELYIKDEDYRLSFFHGNYITGTNLTKDVLQRIKEFKLSPLYLSIHSTNPVIRGKMLGLKSPANPISLLKYLKKANIKFHTQIVLCPDINDGNTLKNTIIDLIKFFPSLLSIAIVPVGLTKHRKRLPAIKPVTSSYAQNFLKKFLPLKREVSKKIGKDILFFSDEFYLLADREPLMYSNLHDFPQLENGVGMFANFYAGFRNAVKKLPSSLNTHKKIGIITSPLGEKVLRKAVNALDKIENLKVKVMVVRNHLFGSRVTVTGLLSGEDILNTIKQNPDCDKFLIPGNCIKFPEEVFLDDLSLQTLINKSLSPVEIIINGVKEFFLKCIS